MIESKYEKYIIRNAAKLKKAGKEIIEEITGETPSVPNAVDMGFRVIFSKKRIKDGDGIIEYGFVTEDAAMGTGQDFHPHKHGYPEMFLFLGTNPKDIDDLGAEVEFWIGEGKDLEKIRFSTPSSIYMPPNVAHFPQIWRNVKRPVMNIVIMPRISETDEKPVVR
jgi:hypothetical protein